MIKVKWRQLAAMLALPVALLAFSARFSVNSAQRAAHLRTHRRMVAHGPSAHALALSVESCGQHEDLGQMDYDCHFAVCQPQPWAVLHSSAAAASREPLAANTLPENSRAARPPPHA
jgi:hypothetical protein